MSKYPHFLQYFQNRTDQNRYWWFIKNRYMPPIYDNLELEEMNLLMHWFDESEQAKFVGECNIPLMSALLGFISGSGLDSIVQLGHYAGYSALLIGFMLRKIGKRNGLFSIDINAKATQFAQGWIDRAGLDDYVALRISDSANPLIVQHAIEYFGNVPKVVFIDSSHTFQHTLDELNLWFPVLPSGGLIFLHDVSVFAARFDRAGNGGVHNAMWAWQDTEIAESIMLNRTHTGDPEKDSPLVLLDGCGLGVIQKL